jgi:hypothetical protein
VVHCARQYLSRHSGIFRYRELELLITINFNDVFINLKLITHHSWVFMRINLMLTIQIDQSIYYNTMQADTVRYRSVLIEINSKFSMFIQSYCYLLT